VRAPAWEDLPLRPEVRAARPYGPPLLEVPHRLNSNENPYPPPPHVQAAMTKAAESACRSVNRYPDINLTKLRAKLAAYLGHGLTPDQVWAANGSNEIMIQLLLAFAGPGRSVLTFTPSYSMYPEYARDTHTEFLTMERTGGFAVDAHAALEVIAARQPAVIVIANPNNPTGTVTGLDVIASFCEASHGMVVVDEAYQEFSAAPTALGRLADHGNLVVTRTMSKAFAFAGERVGYAAAAPAVIDALRVVRLPYHLSAITQAVAGAALDQAGDMLAEIRHLVELREATIARVRAMGFPVPDSQANFFLLGAFADRHEAWQRLADAGVLVRETGPAGYLRVSVGTDDDMDSFCGALAGLADLERQA